MPPHPDRPLLLLDYDGTLAPIVDDPAAAHPHPDVPPLLDALVAFHPIWIITGRDVPAVDALLDRPLPVMGLHGVQERARDGSLTLHLADDEQRALDRMRAAVPDLDGVWIEDKPPSFAVHYRSATDRAAAEAALAAWAAETPDALAAIHGKTVFELRPKGVDKGVAVTRLAERHPDRTPIYLGDDVTDEDAFAALARLVQDPSATIGTSVTVKVGAGPTRAEHRLRDVEAVVAYLRGFLQAPNPSGQGAS